jgi:hypothetical protein
MAAGPTSPKAAPREEELSMRDSFFMFNSSSYISYKPMVLRGARPRARPLAHTRALTMSGSVVVASPPTFVLSGNEEVETIRGERGVEYVLVRISNCAKLKRLEGFALVKKLDVAYCDALEELPKDLVVDTLHLIRTSVRALPKVRIELVVRGNAALETISQNELRQIDLSDCASLRKVQAPNCVVQCIPQTVWDEIRSNELIHILHKAKPSLPSALIKDIMKFV